jgi:hypothetical protein
MPRSWPGAAFVASTDRAAHLGVPMPTLKTRAQRARAGSNSFQLQPDGYAGAGDCSVFHLATTSVDTQNRPRMIT